MAFQDLLEHTCDISHLRRQDKSPGYGLPESPAFDYPQSPDETGVPCHFHIVRRHHIGGQSIRQEEPFARYQARIKLSLPAGTDVRLNDRIEDTRGGHRYIAENPREVRGHHIVVMLRRPEGEEGL